MNHRLADAADLMQISVHRTNIYHHQRGGNKTQHRVTASDSWGVVFAGCARRIHRCDSYGKGRGAGVERRTGGADHGCLHADSTISWMFLLVPRSSNCAATASLLEIPKLFSI